MNYFLLPDISNLTKKWEYAVLKFTPLLETSDDRSAISAWTLLSGPQD
jgi:hypothetical protein